jgi:hypothetical protein
MYNTPIRIKELVLHAAVLPEPRIFVAAFPQEEWLRQARADPEKMLRS